MSKANEKSGEAVREDGNSTPYTAGLTGWVLMIQSRTGLEGGIARHVVRNSPVNDEAR